MSHRNFAFGLILVATFALILPAGCIPTLPPTDSNLGPTKLVPFSSSGDLLAYFRQQASPVVQRRGFGGLLGAEPAADQATNGGNESPSAGEDAFSSTNLQEAGVDESDVFKSDGQRFYVARNSELVIIRAAPAAELAVLGRIDLGEAIESLYLVGQRIIALAHRYDTGGGGGVGRPEILIYPPYYTSRSAVVAEIDVSDPANPTLIRKVELDGSIAHSRLVNGRLLLVLTIAPDLTPLTDRGALRNVTIAEVLPKLRIGGESRPLADWEQWLRPTSPDGYYMTAVVTLDAADVSNVVASTAVLAGAGTVYASTRALYLTDLSYNGEGAARAVTAIHKFAFGDDGAARYVGSGSAPGRLLNQFSLGEHDGFLRIASHIDAIFFAGGNVGAAVADAPVSNVDARAQSSEPAGPSNAVFVLEDAGAELKIVGSITDIAPNERIYSARFIGERGFLVTFRQIDPLFALDLRDPTKPAIVGELKIPGYSDYLHPVGENLLIGVGRSTRVVSFGGVVPDKLQLSLFDVSNLADPALVQQIEVGGSGSWSEVSSTHKAFVYMPDSALLAIPAALQPPNNGLEFVEPAFDGVLCYRVTAAGFELVGQLPAVQNQGSGGEPFPVFFNGCGGRRPAFVGAVLYAVSADGVRAGVLPGLDPRYEVTWPAP